MIRFGRSRRVSRTLVSFIFSREFSDPFLPSKLKHLLGLYLLGYVSDVILIQDISPNEGAANCHGTP
jgi:hypothetical protein